MAIRRNPGRDGADDPSSARTQRVPGMLVEAASLDVSIAVDSASLEATLPTVARPNLIVLEERSLGLADALARLGFLVRRTQTAVETLSLVADRPPNAVIVGPGDVERRRVLTGALRLRFPTVAIVLVLQKVDDAVVDAARYEGAQAVWSWPLPQESEIFAAVPRSQSDDVSGAPLRIQPSGLAARTVLIAPSAALPPLPSSLEQPALYSADGSAEGSMLLSRPSAEGRVRTDVTPARPPTLPAEFLTPLPTPAPPSSPPPDATKTVLKPRLDLSGSAARPPGIVRRPSTSPNDDLATLNVARVNIPQTREGDETVETTPGKPAADVQDAITPRGEIREVLRAVAPFLWGLDDCARYLEDLHAQDQAGAETHARTVRLVARLLAQLQARVDEL